MPPVNIASASTAKSFIRNDHLAIVLKELTKLDSLSKGNQFTSLHIVPVCSSLLASGFSLPAFRSFPFNSRARVQPELIWWTKGHTQRHSMAQLCRQCSLASQPIRAQLKSAGALEVCCSVFTSLSVSVHVSHIQSVDLCRGNLKNNEGLISIVEVNVCPLFHFAKAVVLAPSGSCNAAHAQPGNTLWWAVCELQNLQISARYCVGCWMHANVNNEKWHEMTRACKYRIKLFLALENRLRRCQLRELSQQQSLPRAQATQKSQTQRNSSRSS